MFLSTSGSGNVARAYTYCTANFLVGDLDLNSPPAVSLRPGQSIRLRATATGNVYIWAYGSGAELVYAEESA